MFSRILGALELELGFAKQTGETTKNKLARRVTSLFSPCYFAFGEII
jgi:hypothetical protein